MLSSHSQLLSLAQHLKTAYAQCFHFGQSRQTCCSLQHDTKPLVGSLTAHISCSWENALRFNRNKKSADQKLTACVCTCVYASLTRRAYVCVCVVVLAFLYPIQEEAEFCVTLVYWKHKWPLKQQHFSRWHWLWAKWWDVVSTITTCL